MKLYAVRHAIAEEADSSRWPDDSKRPLTEDGRERFRAAARGLQAIVPSVDAVLSSGYVRAWQTAELLHDVAGWPTAHESRELEAGKRPSAALDALRGPQVQSLAVVGHEPFLSELVSLLCTGSEDALRLELKKGAVAFVRCDDSVAPGSGLLKWSLSQKLLIALAPAA